MTISSTPLGPKLGHLAEPQPILDDHDRRSTYRVSDELEQSGDGLSDDRRSKMTNVHFLGDIGRGEIDDHLLVTGCHGRTNTLDEREVRAEN